MGSLLGIAEDPTGYAASSITLRHYGLSTGSLWLCQRPRVVLLSHAATPRYGHSAHNQVVAATLARNIVQPILDRIARVCLRAGISANALTVLGMLVGVCAALLVANGHAVAGVAVLWLSGTIGAADGTLARLTRPSALGAILDITLDRVQRLPDRSPLPTQPR